MCKSSLFQTNTYTSNGSYRTFGCFGCELGVEVESIVCLHDGWFEGRTDVPLHQFVPVDGREERMALQLLYTLVVGS